MTDERNDRDEQEDQDEGGTLAHELREQVRALQEESRRIQREAAERERELKERLQREAREREQDFARGRRDERGERSERRDRGDRSERGDRRGSGRGRGGHGWAMGPMGPGPMPPMPPLPPLPPIPGAGGTFTPFDVLGGFGAMFGGGPGPGGRLWHGGRGRAGRGDVRITVLILLDEGPANGYQLMQEIEKRTNGGWKPSSGSIYPALQQLEDEGIVRTTEGEGRKMFALTEQGRQYVHEHRAEWTAPWEGVEEDEGATEEAAKIRDVIAQLAMAYMQVIQVGTESQRSEASRVLVGARQALYRILAGDSSEG
ncbi:PadR family transcriptional regulator [Catenulispora subtropica]